jgi:ribose/xylose/arabinose/galactoside ABC-type transport system permease subunit
MSYIFCGLCAGLAGLLQTAENKGADASQMGVYWELDAILAVVLGGTSLTGGRFSLTGAVLGAFLIVTLTTSIQSKVPVEYALIPKAIVVIVVCLLQSDTFRRKVFRR